MESTVREDSATGEDYQKGLFVTEEYCQRGLYYRGALPEEPL